MVAWRRGLLKEGYPHGLRSYVRERMILDMVSDELLSEAYNDMSLTTAALLATHAAGKPMKDLYSSISDRMEFSIIKKEYYPGHMKSSNEAREKLVESAAKIFKSLRESGVLERFDRKATELHNRFAENTE